MTCVHEQRNANINQLLKKKDKQTGAIVFENSTVKVEQGAPSSSTMRALCIIYLERCRFMVWDAVVEMI